MTDSTDNSKATPVPTPDLTYRVGALPSIGDRFSVPHAGLFSKDVVQVVTDDSERCPL